MPPTNPGVSRQLGGPGSARRDERPDRHDEEPETEDRHDALQDDGSRTGRLTREEGGNSEKPADGGKEPEERHRRRGVHGVLAKVLLPGDEAADSEEDAEARRGSGRWGSVRGVAADTGEDEEATEEERERGDVHFNHLTRRGASRIPGPARSGGAGWRRNRQERRRHDSGGPGEVHGREAEPLVDRPEGEGAEGDGEVVGAVEGRHRGAARLSRAVHGPGRQGRKRETRHADAVEGRRHRQGERPPGQSRQRDADRPEEKPRDDDGTAPVPVGKASGERPDEEDRGRVRP